MPDHMTVSGGAGPAPLGGPPAGGPAGTDERRQDVVLIGPMFAGKSTVGRLLSRRLGLPQVAVDLLRYRYYEEIGYDFDHDDRLRREGRFPDLARYWKPFEAHAVERILAEHRDCVIDFGAGHSVYEDEALFRRVRRALAPFDNVVLLLPSPDPDESLRLLRQRYPPDFGVDAASDPNEHFVRHRSNRDLATLVIYTAGKTPEGTADEVAGRIRRSPAWGREGPPRREHANALWASGLRAVTSGDLPEARDQLRAGLRAFRERGDAEGTARSLEGLAALAAAEGRPEAAFELDGAALALRGDSGKPRGRADQRLMDRLLGPARAALGDAVAAARATGMLRPTAEAVSAALRAGDTAS